MSTSKLLVIDDNSKICSLIKEYGEERYGYQIDVVEGISQALKKMKQTTYHLIT